MAVTLVLSILVILVILYLFLTKNYKYWQKRGIPCPDGALPGVGHAWEVATQKITMSECCCKIYNAYRDRSMVGIYNFMTPMLMVREPELVKTVLQTSFTNFHENGFKIDPKLDPLLANNPFFTYGEKWMTGRKRLTYAFSSMRLKILLETVKQVCQTFEGYLDKKIDKAGKVELELKELFSRFTSQVVSSAGFGVDGLSFNEEKEKDSFYALGKSFLDSTVLNNIIFIIVFFIPALGRIFKTRFLPKKADHFFRTIIADIMEQRRKETTPRNDFLQLMTDLERTEGDKFDLEILTSHAVSFFVDGYETSSAVLSFIGFNLANNPKVQEKLREEVMSVLNKYDGVITYEALKDMTYMDQVINESMRFVPILGILSKVCTDETELRGSDGLVYRVERGMHIIIPVSGLQEDPRYWENPKEFDPDRFGPDRKHNIEKFTFLPFGEGPRMCVGMRMAQLQIKACLATFLRKYSIELSPKTQLPLKMVSSIFLANAEGGLWSIIRPI
ncbi:PREDICTED: cytochrome P450 9e2-like [Trachymyrmex cornetzi]|uniref:Cytochrome P450 9e2 n=1 Tax=Trachymyrmex cornetzi TaxID=471704 RepID=A0A195EHW7_9HYME|nr:PREDICTED: cytochrome P450 9e2-like [Trachymyrmex cornetzi]KYN27751.1 Cytochrome P450 9e2 [Trachymyrmex cornetzi]